jgi:hypothetical protein
MTNFKPFFFQFSQHPRKRDIPDKNARTSIIITINNRDDNAPTPPGCDEAAVGAQTSSTT